MYGIETKDFYNGNAEGVEKTFGISKYSKNENRSPLIRKKRKSLA